MREALTGRVAKGWRWLRGARMPFAGWLACLFVVAGGAGVAWGSWKNLCADCPSVAQIHGYEPRQTSKLFARDSTLVWEFGEQRRTLVPLASLPPHVPNAFIAIEDRRFYEHRGLDWRGIARAGIEVLRTRSLSGAGGSTITQQLARHMWTERIGFEKRILRKLKEWQVALALERAYSKEQILEAYVNQIGYAHGWYGIQRASQSYFGKDAIDLNPAEGALLAAIANLPEHYSPLNNPEAGIRRRNLVLDVMAQQGYLTEDEAAHWKAQPVPLVAASRGGSRARYFVEWARGILDDRFGARLYTDGLRIHTSLDLDMQAIAETAMRHGWDRVESWPGFRHPTYREFAEENDGADLPDIPYVQGMFVATDPATGEVLAMVGGRDFVQSKFNRAVQARRQAGSAFKPIVYAAALESGIPASEVVVDAPVVLDQVDGTTWRPSNYEPEFLGPITVRHALARSINMVAIKIGMRVGLESVGQMAARLGIRTEVERFPSTAIGAAEVIPIQLVEAYSTFANMGTRVRPFPIVRVEDAAGEVLWEPRPERARVLDPEVARLAVSLLESVVAEGTGATGVRIVGGLPAEVPAAGKTGTTNEGSNVWFMGFTPSLVAGVWFGMDQPVPIAPRATGGGFAAPVWGEFMRRVYYGSPDAAAAAAGDDVDAAAALAGLPAGPLLEIPGRWGLPGGLVTRRVDGRTGALASRWCPADEAYDELYLRGTEPTVLCDRSMTNEFATMPPSGPRLATTGSSTTQITMNRP